jgi:hypothetical protein
LRSGWFLVAVLEVQEVQNKLGGVSVAGCGGQFHRTAQKQIYNTSLILTLPIAM